MARLQEQRDGTRPARFGSVASTVENILRMVQPGNPGRPYTPTKPGEIPNPTPIDPDPQGPPDYHDPPGPTYEDEPPLVPLDG